MYSKNEVLLIIVTGGSICLELNELNQRRVLSFLKGCVPSTFARKLQC